MKTREQILAWLEDLERVIDKSVATMEASSDRIDDLEAYIEQLERDLSHAKACTEVWKNRARKAEGQAIELARTALAPEQDR